MITCVHILISMVWWSDKGKQLLEPLFEKATVHAAGNKIGMALPRSHVQ